MKEIYIIFVIFSPQMYFWAPFFDMQRNCQIPHNCHTWKAKISLYDNFSPLIILVTNMRSDTDIRADKQILFAKLTSIYSTKILTFIKLSFFELLFFCKIDKHLQYKNYCFQKIVIFLSIFLCKDELVLQEPPYLLPSLVTKKATASM